jgi:hypothetical protein
VANTHKQLELLEGCVDRFYSSLKSHTWIWSKGSETNTTDLHHLDSEMEALKISFFNKLEKNCTVFKKRFISFKDQLDQVIKRCGGGST